MSEKKKSSFSEISRGADLCMLGNTRPLVRGPKGKGDRHGSREGNWDKIGSRVRMREMSLNPGAQTLKEKGICAKCGVEW